jgi:hypothetical protein
MMIIHIIHVTSINWRVGDGFAHVPKLIIDNVSKGALIESGASGIA